MRIRDNVAAVGKQCVDLDRLLRLLIIRVCSLSFSFLLQHLSFLRTGLWWRRVPCRCSIRAGLDSACNRQRSFATSDTRRLVSHGVLARGPKCSISRREYRVLAISANVPTPVQILAYVQSRRNTMAVAYLSTTTTTTTTTTAATRGGSGGTRKWRRASAAGRGKCL